MNAKNPPKDIWRDHTIKEVLKSRPADDIAVMDCPQCGQTAYYNQGSHFSCRFGCGTWYVCSEDEEPPLERRWMSMDTIRTLADTIEDRNSDAP